MKKCFKIFVVLFTLLMLVTSLPIGSFALTADAVGNPMHNTYVCDDLMNMGYNVAEYPVDASDDSISVIKFLEYGFDYHGDQRYYGLYIYLYNPSGKAISINGNNSVQLSFVDYDGKKTTNTKYACEVLSVSNDDTNSNVFIKLYISASRNIAHKINAVYREYYVNSVEFDFGGNKLKDYATASYWTYQGFQENFGRNETSPNTLYWTKDVTEVCRTELASANWFSDAWAGTNGEYMYEMSSVAFTVPSYFIKKYGDPFNQSSKTRGLKSVQGEYYKYVTDGLIISDADFYNYYYFNSFLHV